jgi:DNA-binding NarL/FixJ family response regulator
MISKGDSALAWRNTMRSPFEIALVIIAPPGRQRDGLRVLVKAYAKIELVGEADDLATGAQVITERTPALVVIQSGQVGETFGGELRELKTQCPNVRFAVVVPDYRQEELARAAGADAVLLEGFTSETIFATIDKMLDATA